MRFLADIIDKKRNIVEKVKNNDFHFNQEELFLIGEDADLRRMSFSRLALGREYWTDDAVSYLKNNAASEDIAYIDPAIFYYYCLEEIDAEDLTELDELMDLSSKPEEIEAYLCEKLKDSNYKPKSYLTNNILQILVKTNRYDLLASITKNYYDIFISPQIEDAVIENYPYSYSSLPFPLSEEKLQRKRENLAELNVYELFELFSMQRYRLFDTKKEDIFYILKEKVFSSGIDFSCSFPISCLNGINEFYERISSSEKEQFRNIMLYNEPTWYLERASEDEIKNNISILCSVIRKRKIELKGKIDKESFLLQNKEFLDTLLELENFSLLFRSPLLPEYVSKIIAKLGEENLLYRNQHAPTEELFPYFYQYPEIFRAMLRNNYYSHFPNILEKMIKGTVLEHIMEEEAYQNKSAFSLPFTNDFTLKQLIMAENIDCILKNHAELFSFFDIDAPVILSEEECTHFINGIKNDISLQHNALELVQSIIFFNPSILQFYLHSNSLMLELTIDYINHHENLRNLYTDELYHTVKEYYASKYHLNLDKLDQLESTFGPTIIRFFDNDTLKKITDLEDKKFVKLIALFPKTEFSFSLLETTYDSIKQYAFGKEHSDIISIFARINHSVQDETEEYKQDLEKLLSVMNDKFYKRFGKRYPSKVEICKSDPKLFLEYLISQMRSVNPNEKEEAMAILHTITDYFIAVKREQYREKYDMKGDLQLPYEVDQKDFEKQIMFYLLNLDVGVLINRKNSMHKESLPGLFYGKKTIQIVIDELIKEGMEESLAMDVIACYLKRDSFINDIKTVQKNVRFAIPIIKRVVMERIRGNEEYEMKLLDEQGKVKRNYYVPKSVLDPYQILTALRIDSLEKNLLEDTEQAETMYQSLLHTMEKYKLHIFPSCFKDLLESDSIGLSCDFTDMAGFISYYHQVYESEKRKLESQGKSANHVMLSLTNVLVNANVLGSVSSVYNQFLGTEDARLVKANPGPNYATDKTSGDQRLKEAVAWTLKNFQKMEVTIPSFSESVSFGDKKMRVVVGNFTHPSNITHGERTGACMRIGGVGESLFEFCLEDKNGFHIRFEDENTGEYISRVSGFRNGNTVFLNELRNSCNSELYSDEEIIEACKKISSTMIEMSKNSTCPIENVVVARAYATSELPQINLGISNNKKGLRAFYSDIQSSGIVLASTGEPYTKIELDISTVPSYVPVREKTYVGTDSMKLMDMINRVHSVNQALSGVEYEYVEPVSFENEVVYGFVNQDWYIYMDSAGNIFEELIPIDKRAKEELENARKLIESYVPTKIETEGYQY